MNTPLPPPLPLTDSEIHALIDNQVHGAERQVLLNRLQHDPDARARLESWKAQRDAIRGLHHQLLDEPVPAVLLDAARGADTMRHRLARWQHWGGLAAGVIIAFMAGWTGHARWPGPTGGPGPLAFARDAAFAHAVYSPETRHPVEVAASEQAHLVQWLSRRTGKALKIPDLTAQGYGLVGGRLLPGEAGARAQFMYQSAQGTRVTLYLGAVTADASPELALASRETAFRFTDEGPVPGFYWMEQGFGYALSGPLSREALMALAEAVYRQRE